MHKFSMKQISIIVSVIVFSILLLAVMIILNYTKGDVRIDVLKDITKVGLVLSGTKDDRSWSQSHYDALERIASSLNLEIVYRENVDPDKEALGVIRELANDGCRIIVANSLGYSDEVTQAAAELPGVYFLNPAGNAEGSNVATFFGRMYQMRYLSGIVAGIQTKTDSIGYVAAFDNSEVNRGINAFTLGVRKVNPDAVVHVSFCSSWTDSDAARECAEKLIVERNIDVITLHVDAITPLEAADEHGIWSIGYNYDNAEYFPDSFLTGCVWKWDSYYKNKILECLQGKFEKGESWLGIDSGIMELADLSETGLASFACKKPLEEAKKRFDTYSFDVFYGPVKDNTGEIRIPEGESMSDVNMLTKFDWYVEGVEID